MIFVTHVFAKFTTENADLYYHYLYAVSLEDVDFHGSLQYSVTCSSKQGLVFFLGFSNNLHRQHRPLSFLCHIPSGCEQHVSLKLSLPFVVIISPILCQDTTSLRRVTAKCLGVQLNWSTAFEEKEAQQSVPFKYI